MSVNFFKILLIKNEFFFSNDFFYKYSPEPDGFTRSPAAAVYNLPQNAKLV